MAAAGFNGGEQLEPRAKPRFFVESDTERRERERAEYWNWTNRVRAENRDGKRA